MVDPSEWQPYFGELQEGATFSLRCARGFREAYCDRSQCEMFDPQGELNSDRQGEKSGSCSCNHENSQNWHKLSEKMDNERGGRKSYFEAPTCGLQWDGRGSPALPTHQEVDAVTGNVWNFAGRVSSGCGWNQVTETFDEGQNYGPMSTNCAFMTADWTINQTDGSIDKNRFQDKF
jgi:hypothetical protein